MSTLLGVVLIGYIWQTRDVRVTPATRYTTSTHLAAACGAAGRYRRWSHLRRERWRLNFMSCINVDQSSVLKQDTRGSDSSCTRVTSILSHLFLSMVNSGTAFACLHLSLLRLEQFQKRIVKTLIQTRFVSFRFLFNCILFFLRSSEQGLCVFFLLATFFAVKKKKSSPMDYSKK